MYCYYVHTRLTSDDDVTGPSLRCFYGAVGKVGRWGFLRSWRRRWCDGLLGRWGFLRCRRWCDGLGGCSGLLRDFFWRDHLLDGSPLPPRAWQGRPRRPVCGRKRLRCSASPSTRFTLWGLAKTRPGPHNLLPVRISSALATPGVPRQAAAAVTCNLQTLIHI